MVLIQRARKKAFFPVVARPSSLTVFSKAVSAEDTLESKMEAVELRRYRNDVKVICHEAVSKGLDRKLIKIFCHKFQK